MRSSRRLARIEFIASGAAFLTACSAHGTSFSTVPSVKGSSNSRDIASTSTFETANGNRGFQISSSKSGHAIALHTSKGRFLSSFAVGSGFERHTLTSGRQLVLDRMLPAKKGWFHLEGGGAFGLVR